MMKTINLICSLLLVVVCLSLSFNPVHAQGNGGDSPEFVLFKYYKNGNITNPVDSLGTLYFKAMPQWKDPFHTAVSIQAQLTGIPTNKNVPASLVFRTGAVEQFNRMAITTDGLVGIGTIAPAFNLHTEGDTYTSGDFFGRIHFDDNQLTDDAPDTYIDESYFELKQRSVLNLPLGLGTHGGLMSLAPGGGSFDHQLFFAEDGVFTRRWAGDANSWAGSTWYKLLTGEDINGTPNRIAKFTGPNSLGDSQLWDDGTRVGIGTDTPLAGFMLDVNGNTRIDGNQNITSNLTVQTSADINQNLHVGNSATINNNLSVSNVTNTGSLTVQTSADINQNINIGNDATVGGDLTVSQTATVAGDANLMANATIGNDLTVNSDADVLGNIDVSGTAHIEGKVSIGTTSTPGGHELYVGGSMIAEEVVVKLSGNWPDYVFAPDYQLPDLAQLEAYIQTNRHLPGIPSAAEVARQGGVAVGETQRLLLEKIEELTLIVIEQQKQIKALQNANQ